MMCSNLDVHQIDNLHLCETTSVWSLVDWIEDCCGGLLGWSCWRNIVFWVDERDIEGICLSIVWWYDEWAIDKVLRDFISKCYKVFRNIKLKLLGFIKLYQFVYDIVIIMFQLLRKVLHLHISRCKVDLQKVMAAQYMNHL